MDTDRVFRWQAARGGYEWVDSLESRVVDNPAADLIHFRVLREGLHSGAPPGSREYDPMAESALFRRFANLATDLASIRLFANEYGLLRKPGIDRPWVTARKDELGKYTPGPIEDSYYGEHEGTWTRAILEMRRAVRLWDLVEQRERQAISFVLVRRDPDNERPATRRYWQWAHRPAYSLPETIRDALSMNGARPVHKVFYEGDEGWHPTDVVAVAASFVRYWINSGLCSTVSPRLQLDPGSGESLLVHHPISLLGALWLQFANAIAGKRKQRQCKVCGTWFDISGYKPGKTKRRVFCSDQCKSRDYRDRRDRAQLLKAQGNSPTAIAEELDTDIETINKWVTKRKG
jgi:hypothetical protein